MREVSVRVCVPLCRSRLAILIYSEQVCLSPAGLELTKVYFVSSPETRIASSVLPYLIPPIIIHDIMPHSLDATGEEPSVIFFLRRRRYYYQ